MTLRGGIGRVPVAQEIGAAAVRVVAVQGLIPEIATAATASSSADRVQFLILQCAVKYALSFCLRPGVQRLIA